MQVGLFYFTGSSMYPTLRDDIYRGFFPGRTQFGQEKIPSVSKIDDNSCMLQIRADKSPNVLGYLRDGVLLVDFDTAKDCVAFDRILNGLGLKVPALITNHGKHFYFKANDNCVKAMTKVMIACGLKADFKLGAKRGLDCVKFHGEYRKWENPDAPLLPLPDFCRPLKEQPSKSGESLAELVTGSRNDTLFKYNGRLFRSGFTMVESQGIIRNIINKYVLPEPLDEADILSVTRDELYVQDTQQWAATGPGAAPALDSFFERNKFRHDRLSAYLIKRWHVIDVERATFFFTGKSYTRLDSRTFGRKLVELYPELTETKRNEVYKHLVLAAPEITPQQVDGDLKYIAFNNGVLNIETNELLEPSHKFLVFNLIPHDYNVAASSSLLEQFLDAFTCGDVELKKLIGELVGHCFYRKNTIRGCFILLGNKRNGKSTLLEFLSYVIGRENVSQLKMQEINERFKTAELEGKLANIGDDISDEYISDPNRIKSAITSNPLTVERKGEDPRTIIPYATQIFSANELPLVKDTSGAMLDRLNIITCNAFFAPNVPGYDPNITMKLMTEEAASYMIRLGVEGLQRILSAKQLTRANSSQAVMDDYKSSVNPVLGFLSDPEIGLASLSQLDGAFVDDVFAHFKEYCEDKGVRATSKEWFVRKMKAAIFNLTTESCSSFRNRSRVFRKKDSKNPLTFNK